MQQAGWSNIWPLAPASASNQWREVWRHPRDPGIQPLQSGRGRARHKEGDRPDINPRTLLLPYIALHLSTIHLAPWRHGHGAELISSD